jgi:hypothetical protein
MEVFSGEVMGFENRQIPKYKLQITNKFQSLKLPKSNKFNEVVM